MKAIFSGLMLSVAALAMFSNNASAACVSGDTKQIREYVNNGGDNDREENVTYVCVAGIWRQNGYVPQYPAPCKNGATRFIKETQSYGDNDREVNVPYVCKAGVWRQYGNVPKYPAPCKNGATRFIKELQSYGDHDREVNVPYVCVRGIWKMQ